MTPRDPDAVRVALGQLVHTLRECAPTAPRHDPTMCDTPEDVYASAWVIGHARGWRDAVVAAGVSAATLAAERVDARADNGGAE